MSMFIAALVFIPLLAASLALLLWAFGRSWPIRNRKLLAQSISGQPSIEAMPNGLVLFVFSIALLFAGIVALGLADHGAGGLGLSLLGTLVGLMFLARGVIGFSAAWQARTPAEPFRTLDRKTYSPLSLAIGIGFLLLVLLRVL